MPSAQEVVCPVYTKKRQGHNTNQEVSLRHRGCAAGLGKVLRSGIRPDLLPVEPSDEEQDAQQEQ